MLLLTRRLRSHKATLFIFKILPNINNDFLTLNQVLPLNNFFPLTLTSFLWNLREVLVLLHIMWYGNHFICFIYPRPIHCWLLNSFLMKIKTKRQTWLFGDWTRTSWGLGPGWWDWASYPRGSSQHSSLMVINAKSTFTRCNTHHVAFFYPNCNASLTYNQGGSVVREPVAKAGDPGSIPGLGRFPWMRAWKPTPVFLPGELHGQRSLVGYSPWGCRVRHNWATEDSTWHKDFSVHEKLSDFPLKSHLVPLWRTHIQ